jgi:hypothetical protein
MDALNAWYYAHEHAFVVGLVIVFVIWVLRYLAQIEEHLRVIRNRTRRDHDVL